MSFNSVQYDTVLPISTLVNLSPDTLRTMIQDIELNHYCCYIHHECIWNSNNITCTWCECKCTINVAIIDAMIILNSNRTI
jgi:hypothetical protein